MIIVHLKLSEGVSGFFYCDELLYYNARTT